MLFIHLTPTGRTSMARSPTSRSTIACPAARGRHADGDARVPERRQRDARRAVPLGPRDGGALRDVQRVPRPARSRPRRRSSRRVRRTCCRRSARMRSTWNATHEDPDIADDISLIDHFVANLQAVGGYGQCGGYPTDGPDGGYDEYPPPHDRPMPARPAVPRLARGCRARARARGGAAPQAVKPRACSTPRCSRPAATRTCRRSARRASRSFARCPSGCATATRTTRSASSRTSTTSPASSSPTRRWSCGPAPRPSAS